MSLNYGMTEGGCFIQLWKAMLFSDEVVLKFVDNLGHEEGS